MKFLRWLFGLEPRFKVGDRVEIVSGVYRIAYDMGISRHFIYGEVTEVPWDSSMVWVIGNKDGDRKIAVQKDNLKLR